MQWRVRTEPTGNALTDMHAASFASVAHLYDGQDPKRRETYARRAEEIAPWFSAAHRAALADAVSGYLRELGAGPAALAQAEKLRHPEAVAVVTGQQAGLFTGPLYSLYKALSAVGLAERLEQELGRPVVPVFWVASEDHDWAEVNHAYVIDSQDEVCRIRLRPDPPLHQMVYHTPLTEAMVDEVLCELRRRLPAGEEAIEAAEWLRAAWRPGESLAPWFARVLLHLTGDRGLVVLDPCLPPLRRLIGSVWVQTLLRCDDVIADVDEAYAEVARAGFQPNVVRDVSHSMLFYVHHGQRFALERVRSGVLRARGLGMEQSVDAWAKLAEADPTAFSANVLLRPVVQDHLIPTLAYVGGPAEIAYHTLARGVFHAHGRRLPPLLHRQRMVLLPPTVVRNARKLGLRLDRLLEPRDLVAPALADLGLRDVTEALARMRRETEARWQRFGEAFAHLGPQMRDMAAHQMRSELYLVNRMESRSARLIQQRHDAYLRQYRHIERWLWTDGQPQERRLCPVAVWARYGLRSLTGLPAWGDYDLPCPVYEVELP
ncbi:hypothetical protein GCM10010885_03330 [Alicyclobacillus cellulosilyticus]|uniref:Putative cysteine ligase BshC n=1 Tax=Alicyclobacillus cellulosilyticus TaxID=1003997 RepID=A0A917K404_9BACL|nr:bacillithiol biosynthesis cysteine-adding enzyme BshC [Alicyclobacillus cellulosilyticus]GGI97074.1 hypothetical protein GCM10010885_03330 [Alicyclobacillus cellulosilyticus]